MAIIAGIAGAGIAAAGSIASSKSANDANARMYRTRYQTQVKDLKKAGLNPMLAYMNGAPNAPQAVPADLSGAVETGSRIYSAANAAKVQQAQQVNIQADTALKATTAAKTAAETKILQDQGLFSAESFEASRDKVRFEVSKLQEDIRVLENTQNLQRIDIEQVKPLAVKAQEIINTSMKLGLSEQEATAKLWDELGSMGKGMQFLLPILKMLLGSRVNSGPKW